MAIELPALPYDRTALEPHISAETIDYHYSKHHQTYVTNLNNLIAGTEFESADLETIVRKSQGGLFNNAAQIWNHTFYWNSLRSGGGGTPGKALLQRIEQDFGSVDTLKKEFMQAAVTQFGSGWAWLVVKDGKLSILSTPNQDPPLLDGDTAILGLDVWEHAYYLKYQNRRGDYASAWWNVVNWDKVSENFAYVTEKKAGVPVRG